MKCPGMLISNYNSMVTSLVKKRHNNILPKIKNHAISPTIPIAIAQMLRFTKPQTAIKPRIIATIRNTNGGAKPWAFLSIVVVHLLSVLRTSGENLYTTSALPRYREYSIILSHLEFFPKFSRVFCSLYYKYFSIMGVDSVNGFFPKILKFFNWSLPPPIHLDCKNDFLANDWGC